jgi:hypothetical protein
LLDKTESVTTENTTSALSHLAFCTLAALGLARQDGIAGTPYAENLFLIRWLATAQKQKRFPKSVAVDISWLLELTVACFSFSRSCRSPTQVAVLFSAVVLFHTSAR